MRDIRVISFDLDDTLWPIMPVIERAELELYAWLEERHPRLTRRFSPRSMRRVRDKLVANEPGRGHDFTWLRKETLRICFERSGYGVEAVGPAFEVFLEHRNQVTLFEDVLPALTRLAQRFTLLALSNGNADLDKIGIAHFFGHSLRAVEVGVAKPHPAMFEAVLARTGMRPGQVLHVGDDPLADVTGAREAGMFAAWVNRPRHDWSAAGEPAHLEVGDLTELVRHCENCTA